ncbi:hypothetical protein XBI1_2810067 [Xenorhabdus bovienii str. Intermedium]|uniref:Uncharacterized protein n=1 Tax=Xenorhabdus bovienii str. Intermedium TaxID=1379677 RepID=A0A077QL94_XENBV|nr:hypothetical protein XBI1_2810067 [Xenorhabdus bovienii str. Intermedium]
MICFTHALTSLINALSISHFHTFPSLIKTIRFYLNLFIDITLKTNYQHPQ